jgi:hypothetical protein
LARASSVRFGVPSFVPLAFAAASAVLGAVSRTA